MIEKKLRAFYVNVVNDDEYSIAVVHENRSKAKSFVWQHCSWIKDSADNNFVNLRCRLVKGVVDIDDIKSPMLFEEEDELLDGLKRGLYGFLIDAQCPACNEDNVYVYYDKDGKKYYCQKCRKMVRGIGA